MRADRRATLGLLTSVALLTTACGEPATEVDRAAAPLVGSPSPASTPATDAQMVAFTLDVSNQCFPVPEVRLVVRIDGEVVVDDVFEVGNQHNRTRFELTLSSGSHEMTAEAPEHGQRFTDQFTIDGEQRWASLSYWGEDNTASEQIFTWMVQDEPPGYL